MPDWTKGWFAGIITMTMFSILTSTFHPFCLIGGLVHDSPTHDFSMQG